MTEFVTSSDDTRIAYDRLGSGPSVILVGGAMQFRAFDPQTGQLAARLAERGFTVVNYDRRGRGESAGRGPYVLDSEIADLRALIAELGGPAALFGSSSGGAICLAAAAAGLPVSKLALWEVPLGPELGADGAEFLAGLQERIASGDEEATIAFYMRDMPPEWVEAARQGPAWPIMKAVSPSLAPDAEALAWTQSRPRADLWSSVQIPVLVLVGEETLPFFPAAAESIVTSVSDGRSTRVPATNHSWELGPMVDVLAEFFAS
ncbi:MAG TPA: alpha/beta hydrolase [Propionibacteriaceae bacterium]|jgi:pimeloyl-ACP methyl ester carboxylesterase|nr:alpha/beta hydrolase [Propionibacteriaceae bacterium]